MSEIPKTIVAQSFVVKDASGTMRVFFGMNSDTQQPIMEMFDEEGKRRIIVGLTDASEPSVSLFDKEGTSRVALALSSDDTSKIVVHNKDKTLGGQLASNDAGPVLSFDFGDGRLLGVIKDIEGRILFGELKEDGTIVKAYQI